MLDKYIKNYDTNKVYDPGIDTQIGFTSRKVIRAYYRNKLKDSKVRLSIYKIKTHLTPTLSEKPYQTPGFKTYYPKTYKTPYYKLYKFGDRSKMILGNPFTNYSHYQEVFNSTYTFMDNFSSTTQAMESFNA